MDPLLLLTAGLAVGSLCLIGYLTIQGNKNPVAQRLSQLEIAAPTSELPRSGRVEAVAPRQTSAQNSQKSKEDASRRKLRERILQAGLYKPNAMKYFHAVRMILGIIPLGIGLVLSATTIITPFEGLLWGGVVGLFATLMPSLWLDWQKKDRQKQIRRALPDALDVIIVCLEAGLTMSTSLARVARELGSTHPMLALELGIVEREIQMGRTTGNAVRAFGQRCDLEELRSLSSVINQAEQFGSSVAKSFAVYADSMRVRRRQRAEESAQKAGVKIVFPTLLCIFPGIFIVVLGPAAINIYTNVLKMFMKNGHL